MTFAAQPAPAGGTELAEVLAAAGVGAIAVVLVVAIGVAHRRRGLLNPLVRLAEKRTGLPAWSTIPVGIAGASLLLAVWGYYWDVSWHIDRGRDPGAFANPAHWFILIGLDGIAFAAILAFFLGDERSPSAVRITDRWYVPAGAILLGACGVVALAGFPLDDIWHRLFGQDVTAWGPTHIQMIGGASLSTLGCWALTIEGRRAAGSTLTPVGRAICTASDWCLAGAFLIGLSTLQVEFDFGVPQFRQIEHPVLIALAASIGLVAARIRVGKGGALFAVAFFLAVRGGLALGVGALGRDVMHFPLYIVEALIVEGVALVVKRDRQLTLGVVAGALIGTVGFAAEWAWSHIWMPLPWSTDMLPDAALLALIAGTAGGLLGGFAGRAVSFDVARQPSPRFAGVAAWIGVVAVIGIALPMTAHRDWTADLVIEPAASGTASVVVKLSPAAAAAADNAAWFHVISWQGSADGSDGGLALTDMIKQGDGTYRSEKPVSVSGDGKTILRLHSGTSLQAIPIYLPEDPAIPAEGVSATNGTRSFAADKRILQREATTDNVNLERLAYVLLAGLAVAWMAVLSWGLLRIERPPSDDPSAPSAPLAHSRPAVSFSTP
jgi:hypothetical protein